jgi:hypothetical protein
VLDTALLLSLDSSSITECDAGDEREKEQPVLESGDSRRTNLLRKTIGKAAR